MAFGTYNAIIKNAEDSVQFLITINCKTTNVFFFFFQLLLLVPIYTHTRARTVKIIFLKEISATH